MPTKVLIFQQSDNFVEYKKGDTVFAEGENGEEMYVVISGSVDIVFRNKVLETVDVGGIFGEGALIDDRPRSATAIAKEDTKLVPISSKRFMFLVQQTPYFALQVMQVLNDRLRNTTLTFVD